MGLSSIARTARPDHRLIVGTELSMTFRYRLPHGWPTTVTDGVKIISATGTATGTATGSQLSAAGGDSDYQNLSDENSQPRLTRERP